MSSYWKPSPAFKITLDTPFTMLLWHPVQILGPPPYILMLYIIKTMAFLRAGTRSQFSLHPCEQIFISQINEKLKGLQNPLRNIYRSQDQTVSLFAGETGPAKLELAGTGGQNVLSILFSLPTPSLTLQLQWNLLAWSQFQEDLGLPRPGAEPGPVTYHHMEEELQTHMSCNQERAEGGCVSSGPTPRWYQSCRSLLLRGGETKVEKIIGIFSSSLPKVRDLLS